MSLPPALAPLAALRQWVTYRLVRNHQTGKSDKLPCHWQTGHVSSAQEPGNWTTYETARTHAGSADKGDGAGVGFVVSPGDPYWFLDIDNCLTADNQWSPLAQALCARLAGAAIEVSQSGRGLHIIGSGPVPAHRCKNIPLGLELYTERRFVALTGTHAVGSCDARMDEAISSVVADFFAPQSGASGPLDDWTSAPCDGWNGPLDDADLIRRARASKPRQSPASALRPGSEPEAVSFAALWDGDELVLSAAWPDTGPQHRAYDASSADMSLAMRLAYWTGRDCERIERLMRMSGLMREKYERRDYIERTIMTAAGLVEKVCSDKVAAPEGPPVEVVLSGPDGKPRALSLSQNELDDKASHLTIEYWLGAAGYSIAYDVFADRLLLNGEPITDHTERRAWLATRELSGLRFAKDLFGDVLRDVAWNNRFHPLQDWLGHIEATWDGVPRLDRWLSTYLGVKDSEFSRTIGSIFLIAAVRRARQPGCKFDELLVLEGPQGIEKSSAVAALCPSRDWFSEDFTVSMSSKELLETTQGKWLVEAPELSKLNVSEVEHVKHLLSRQVDRARMAYERTPTERGRQWVGFATVNADQYLSDPTGNRRFWPVTCGAVDVAAIERDRGQLWAEAAQRETAGEAIRLPRHLWAVAAEEQSARVWADPFVETLSQAFGHIEHGRVRAEDIWLLVGIPMDRRQAAGRKLGEAMRSLGWVRRRVRKNSELSYWYFRGNEIPELSVEPGTRKINFIKPELAVA